MGKTKYILLSLVGIGLYFKFARELVLVRGGFFIGGEVFLLFLPLLLWIAVKAVFDK